MSAVSSPMRKAELSRFDHVAAYYSTTHCVVLSLSLITTIFVRGGEFIIVTSVVVVSVLKV